MKSSEILNDLESLIPLGTLYFINVPKQPAQPIRAPDGWNWFDPPYLNSSIPLFSKDNSKHHSFCQVVVDLCYLIERYHIRATYKELGAIACLRIYFVPSDIQGNRYLDQLRSLYRAGRSLSWHASRYKVILKRLISILDFSLQNWSSGILEAGIILNTLTEYEPFDYKNVGQPSIYFRETSDTDLNYHISRLFKGQPYHYKGPRGHSNQSLENRLTNVYNSIEFGDRYKDFYKQVSRIQGLKSTLYKYQIESIAKMAYNESRTSKQLMPTLLEFKRNENTYYLDLSTLSFRESPEFYESSKGGVLAENMGLGKTLICLSLIILTKFEISEIPDDSVINNVRDYKVLPLFDQCIRVINRHSIPWKSHIDQIPDSCINKLENQPGFFYYKKDQTHQNRSKNSRSKPVVIEEKLLLSSTTLIVVPDNLFNQWSSEIKKHVILNPNVLNVLKLPKNEAIPKASILIKYDLVLITHSTYISEELHNTPLNKVYWKRLIIDEGHSMNQRSSRLVELSKNLKIERRWIVSGTPTSGLTKLHMNENNDAKSHLVKRKFDAKNDLNKLGLLVSNFFDIKPWSNNHDLWNKHFINPLAKEFYQSDSNLLKLMNLLIVRHSLNEIETDVKLPSLHHKATYLTPSHYNKISINLFTAVLAINAVSSEREDKDYMFHPNNKPELRRLVTNLQRSTFHWTGFSTEDLKSMLAFAKVCLEKKDEKDPAKFYYCLDDRKLLGNCIHFCKVALDDKIWRITSNIHEMPYFVNNSVDEILQQNFGIGKTKDNINVFGAPQLYSLQRFFYKNRFSENSELFHEKVMKSSDEFWNHYWKDLTNKKNEKIKNDGKSIEFSQINKELNKKRHMDITENSKSSSNSTSRSKILGSASAKLSYMCSRLLEHQYNNVKSLVFFEFEDSAYYLTESLDLLGVNYILYSTSIPQNQRFQRINQFSEREDGVCLIMDLKLASFGLTITAATRVYFLNPVWNRAVEAQALKRAHRIGQTKTVYVETLVLKDTLEEEMFNRRFAKSDQDVDELKIPVADDNQIRDYITRFDFLRIKKGEKVYDSFTSESTDGPDILNGKEFDTDELLEPVGTKVNNQTCWDIPLFSKGSQLKVVEIEDKRKTIQIKRPDADNPNETFNTPTADRINQSVTFSDEIKTDTYEGDTTESEDLELINSSQTIQKPPKRVRFTVNIEDISNDNLDLKIKKVRFQ